MKETKLEYRNLNTGEITEDRGVAKEWYDRGDDYSVWYYSYALGEKIELGVVTHV